MPCKVVVLALQSVKVIDVEHFIQAARAIPEGYFAVCANAFELIEDVRPHGRHARAATDEDHFGIGFFGKELAVGSRYGHVIAGF